MPKCCPLFLAVGSKSGCVEEGVSSLSILACSFSGTSLPAKLELEGKSRTDGGARVGGENSCSLILLLSLFPPPAPAPQTKLGLPHRIGIQAGAQLFKTKGFPSGWGWCFPWPKECHPASPWWEGEGKRNCKSCLLQLRIHSMLFGLLKEHHSDPAAG